MANSTPPFLWYLIHFDKVLLSAQKKFRNQEHVHLCPDLLVFKTKRQKQMTSKAFASVKIAWS